MRTRIAIIGAGPAGLVLAHLLERAGIDCVVLERRSRTYIEQRVRAGVLEQGTVDLLVATGAGERMRREGLVHEGLELRFGGRGHRIDLRALTGGRCITVYGQQEVVKDLIALRLARGAPLVFEAHDVAIHGTDGDAPAVTFRANGADERVECDFVAGCDGFHGITRASIARERMTIYERTYPFAWLGILAEAPCSSEELVYTHHPRGFALLSMRTPEIARLYVQCPPDEALEDWPDERVWEELHARLATDDGWTLSEGPVLEKGITPMRSFVTEPMRHGRLFLAGDAAHIVPPTGAKGLNLAVADVRVLAEAFRGWYADGDAGGLDGYSCACLDRVWRVQHFSWWMTAMLHRFDDDPFRARLQRAQLEGIVASRAAATALAENYTGLPFDSDAA